MASNDSDDDKNSSDYDNDAGSLGSDNNDGDSDVLQLLQLL